MPSVHEVGAELARTTLRSLGCDVRTREEIVALVRNHGRPPYLFQKEAPEKEIISLSWLVSNRLLYLLALADTRGRKAGDAGRPEEDLHLWAMLCKEHNCFDRPFPFANDQARFLFYRGELSSLFYTPHEDYRCTVTMMSGLPGAGKDTWLGAYKPRLPVVSLDAVRAELEIALREQFSTIPGMNITIGQPISHRIDHMLSGTRAKVAVKIFGDHLGTLRTLAENARKSMESIAGVVDLSVEQQTEIPMLTVRYDRPALARFGLTAEAVAQHLEAAVHGVTVSRVLEGRNAFDLVVRLPSNEREQIDRIRNLIIITPKGARIPIGMVADVRKETTPNVINREQVERKIVVMCNVAGRDVASVVSDIQKEVNPIIAARSGYRVEYSGQFESANEARATLGFLSIVVLFGVVFLLRIAFGSLRDAALVLINLPLALIGGLIGVFLTGGVLSVASLIGFITVFGIATRNGIMLVSHIRHLQESEGVTDFREAVVRGALERLAPILMTALATGLALIPLALGGQKPGNEIQTPMAIVILFGLLTSMLMNMVIVPALYFRFGAVPQTNKHYESF